MHSPPSHPWILIGNSKLLPTKVSALIKIEELECVCVCVCVCRGRVVISLQYYRFIPKFTRCCVIISFIFLVLHPKQSLFSSFGCSFNRKRIEFLTTINIIGLPDSRYEFY